MRLTYYAFKIFTEKYMRLIEHESYILGKLTIFCTKIAAYLWSCMSYISCSLKGSLEIKDISNSCCVYK